MSTHVATVPLVSPAPSRVEPLVVDLRSLPRAGAVGGKAWNLGRIVTGHAPVPPAVVLTAAAFDAFLDAAGLRARIARTCASLDPTRPDDLRTAALGIRALIDAAPLPAAIDAALVTRTRALLAGGPVIVRSSAVGEDGQHASFAGQLNSVLHVRTPEDLRRAVRTCWASYWSDRALFYRLARRASLAGMGVVIQRQVDAAVSGVLFTRRPDGLGPAATGDDAGAMLVEYCAGLGEALVSGWVDPGRLSLSRDAGVATDLQSLPDEASRPAVESRLRPRLGALHQAALALERAFGTPLDIEWTIDHDGALWIVQARPITTPTAAPGGPDGSKAAAAPVAAQAAGAAGAAGASGSPDLAASRVLWSNANVSENFPTPISPLLYSIASAGYARYFGNLGRAFGVSHRRLARMAQPLEGIIGVHGARMYYNLTNIHAVLRLAPFGDALAKAFNRFVGAGAIASPPRDAVTWRDAGSRVRQAAELVRIGAATTWQYLWLARRVRAFEARADAYARETTDQALAAKPVSDLARDLRAFMTIRLDRWTNASLADAAAMVSYAVLDRQLARAGADPACITRLLRALPGVPSSVPPLRLWQLSRAIRDDARLASLFESSDTSSILTTLRSRSTFADFRASFDRFLAEWGFRSSGELMLTEPTLEEAPEPVIDLLREYARAGGESPEAVMARQSRARRTETRRLLGGLAWRAPHRALAIAIWLRWTQRAIVYRERVRLKQARLYTRLRAVVRAAGVKLAAASTIAHADDVFWLTWQELDELCTGRAMFPHDVRALVDLRRGGHARLSAMTPPDTLELPEGAYLPAQPDAPREALDAPGGPSPAPPRGVSPFPVLTGTTACGGHVTARAAVLDDLTQAGRLTRGDVLVTRQTDPGWGPLFCLVSGLVIERGGLLSHGAIIAREFGLPCVVGVAGVARRVPHGAVVTVDGDRGTCTVHKGDGS